VLGSLGHLVLNELWEMARRLRRGLPPQARGIRWFSLHTRVVLWVTAGLMSVGGFLLWWLGTAHETHAASDAWFMAISGRTAGFSTRPMDAMPLPAIVALTGLMFVGGSPGSCAGGIKTTSLAIWFGRLLANLRSEREVSIAGFAIPSEMVWKAGMLMGLATVWNLFGVFLLTVVETAPLETIVFEQVSAFATAGLTLGLTPALSTAGRLWIILSMFVGRVGPLSIVFWMAHTRPTQYRHPVGRVMVG
jgi:trk system potassium uptake protein TrkH